MDSIKIIDKKKQYIELLKIKELINDDWKIMDVEKLDDSDIVLKQRFDTIFNSALKGNWMNENYIEEYILKTKKMIKEYKYEFLIPILCYTCLVDIFKYKMLKQNEFITEIVINLICDAFVSNYEKYGKLLLDQKMIDKFNEIESIRKEDDYPVYKNCSELLEDMNFNMPYNRLLNESLNYMDTILMRKIDDHEFIVFDNNTTEKEMYDAVKEDMDNLSRLGDDVSNEGVYNNLKQILKINELPLEKRTECRNMIIKIYNSEHNLRDRIFYIIDIAVAFTVNNKENNVINYYFRNKKMK